MAEKKISELPIVVDNIYKISDSDVVAMVSSSTTAQITIKTLRDKITEFAAKTGSANTFTGNQIVNGSVTITGKLTVNDIETIYQTSSVVFSSGSNKFGDQSSDKHEFTGSIAMTGSLIVNGDSVNIGTLNSFTSSQLGVNLGTSVVTASFNAFSSSQLGVNLGNSIVTASFNSFSSSQLGVNVGIAIVTSSVNSFTSSQLGVNLGTSIVTASFNEHSRSINERVADIQAYTASVKIEIGQIVAYTASLNTFTASQNVDVSNIQAYTASVKNEVANIQAYTASVKNEIGQIVSYTSSLNAYTQSVKNEVANIQSYTASVKETISQTLAYTASVKSEIGQIVAYTSSLNSYTQSAKIDIANIQAYTASVKNEVANIQAYTASVKNEIGQIVSYTASLNVFTASAKLDIAGLQSYSHSLKSVALVSSSQQIINYNLFALTASANTFYGNQTFNNDVRANKFVFTDGVVSQNVGGQNMIGTSGNILYLYTGTSGLYINNQANNAQNVTISDTGVVQTRGKLTVGAPGNDQDIAFGGSNAKLDWAGTGAQIAYSVGALQFSSVGSTNNMILQQNGGALFNAGITGSLMATNNVVSSSTQVVNYNLFALTASANTFYGTQSVTGSVRISGSIDDIKYIDFDTVEPATGIARLGWDAGEGTLTIGLSGGNVNVPIGAVSFETAYNADSSSISKGDVVRVSGAQGNRVAVKKANNLNDGGSATTIAVAGETIGVGAEGKVLTTGPLKGVDTTAFGEGDLLYLSSTPGGITNIKPQAPFHEVRIGVAQRIHASVGIINIKVDNGYEIDELHNVLIHTASLANKQLLAYSGSVWANQTISELGIAITGSNSFFGTQTITGSLLVTGSLTISSGSITMPNRPAFRVVGNASTDRVAPTLLSGSYVTIDYNEGNHFNSTNGLFTAPIAGLYQIYFNGRAGSVNSQMQVIIHKNTNVSQLMWEAPGNTGVAHFGVSGVVKLAAGDTLQASVVIGSIQFDGNNSWGAAYIG